MSGVLWYQGLLLESVTEIGDDIVRFVQGLAVDKEARDLSFAPYIKEPLSGGCVCRGVSKGNLDPLGLHK